MHQGMLSTENVNNLSCVFFHLKNLQIFANNGFPFFLYKGVAALFAITKKRCLHLHSGIGEAKQLLSLILLYNICFSSVIIILKYKAIICLL